MNKLYIVGNYVEIPDENVINDGCNDKNLIFIGKMDYEPNVLAVVYFCNEIFPIIKQSFPEITFTIIGAKPDKRVLSLKKIYGVRVTGFVESTTPYLQNTSIVVAPMLTGSGIQNKIIQAMAYACCVVTTPIGAEGLKVEESGLTICNSTKSWIESLTELLSDNKKRIRQGQTSRSYIQKTMSKEIVREQFRKFINIK